MAKKNPSGNEVAPATATLSIRIQPRASKNEVVAMEEGGLKVRLTAPPIEGAANEALVRFLAERLSVSKSQIEIIAGHTGRQKLIRIRGIILEKAERLLKSGKE
jgi:uncharacterized protein (TIGR00251 family)